MSRSSLVSFVVVVLCIIFVLFPLQLVSGDDELTKTENAQSRASSGPSKDRANSVLKRQHISNKKLDAIEKEWEKGDEAEELEDEHEHNRKIAAKLNTVDYSDMTALLAMAKKDPLKLSSGTGNKMMFAELKPKKDNGEVWDKASVDKIASRWEGLIRSASLSAKAYNIDQKKILLSVDKTWMLRDVIKFAVVQSEVDVVYLDNKNYTKLNFEELLDDEDEF